MWGTHFIASVKLQAEQWDKCMMGTYRCSLNGYHLRRLDPRTLTHGAIVVILSLQVMAQALSCGTLMDSPPGRQQPGSTPPNSDSSNCAAVNPSFSFALKAVPPDIHLPCMKPLPLALDPARVEISAQHRFTFLPDEATRSMQGAMSGSCWNFHAEARALRAPPKIMSRTSPLIT